MNTPGRDDLAIQTCLDPQAMRALLQTTLPGCTRGGLRIEAVGIAQARRSASHRRHPHPLTLCYDVALRHGDSGQREDQRYYAKLCRDGASARAAAVNGVLHVAALDLLLWPWPADPGLPQLPVLLNPASTRPWWGADATTVEVLHHTPEDRATLRYRHADGRVLYAKAFADDRGAAIHRRFVHFRAAALADPQALQVPEPLGWQAGSRSLWLAAAPGRPLPEALADAHDAAALTTPLARRLALALAAVHAAPATLAGLPCRDAAHWQQEIGRRARKLARALPALAHRAQALADRLAQTLPAHHDAGLGLVHGDVHPGQFCLDGDRLTMLDFDEFCLGHPMEDLASLASRLAPLPGGTALATGLLAHYVQAAPHRFQPVVLRWHLALQALLQASRAFVYQGPGWPQEAERRIAQAEALAAGPGEGLTP